jgi:Tfp pilus assembly protein PilZ
MARKKSDDGKSKKGSPSVTTFLSKISTPKSARSDGTLSSPAKDLLGGVTSKDLEAVGRGDGKLLSPADAAMALEQTEELTIELQSVGGKGDGPGGRTLERVPWPGPVEVRGVFAGAVAGADGGPRASNVSQGGVFVETAHLLEVGDPVVLSFPGDGGARLVVSGRVRWVTPFGRVDDPTPGMGIEFVGLDQTKRDKIASLLSRARAS